MAWLKDRLVTSKNAIQIQMTIDSVLICRIYFRYECALVSANARTDMNTVSHSQKRSKGLHNRSHSHAHTYIPRLQHANIQRTNKHSHTHTNKSAFLWSFVGRRKRGVYHVIGCLFDSFHLFGWLSGDFNADTNKICVNIYRVLPRAAVLNLWCQIAWQYL